MTYLIALLCLSLASFANTASAKPDASSQASVLHYTIIGERSHKTDLFTQGLLIHNGYFYESSGGYNSSLLVSYAIAEPASFRQKRAIAARYFAEGLAAFDNKLYQLTWRENTLLVYDARSLKLINTFNYSGEGWGLTDNGKQLIRSDGSDTLFFHNPDNFAVEKILTVQLEHKSVANLNELEYGEGFIWANIWQDNRILKIDPASGLVVGVLDLSAIVQSMQLRDPDSVLNGIAYDLEKHALWVTGKRWPKMFLLKITH